jgi:hypothetical protein
MNSELISVENNFGSQCACAYSTNFSKEIANEILVLKIRVLLNVTPFRYFFFSVCHINSVLRRFHIFIQLLHNPNLLSSVTDISRCFIYVINYLNFHDDGVSVDEKTKWRIEILSYEVTRKAKT